MKRFQYKINDQQFAGGQNGYLVPLSVHEIAPGETVSGSKQISFNSGTLTEYILNRAFLDVYTFYVPFRILQDGFTEWLTSQGNSGTAPPSISTANQRGHFWEKADTNSGDTTVICWPRYAYNKIWNSFFRQSNDAEISISQNDLQLVCARTSGFHTSETEVDDASFSIGSTVDSMRQAVAQDEFNKLRKYYGDRYVDFLAALGVQANWSILDEPELVAKSQEVMTVNTTKQTDTVVGGLGGAYASLHNHNLKRKFFPEHGLLITVGSFTLQKIFKDAMPAMMVGENPEYYWSPEYDMIKEYEYSERLWWNTATISNKVQLPNFEHLRKGHSLTTWEPESSDDTPAYHGIEDATSTDVYKCGRYDPGASTIFTSLGTQPSGSGQTDFMTSSISRLTKRSPVGTRAGSALR